MRNETIIPLKVQIVSVTKEHLFNKSNNLKRKIVANIYFPFNNIRYCIYSSRTFSTLCISYIFSVINKWHNFSMWRRRVIEQRSC